MSDKIYPTMVIRSQAEAIELLKQENNHLKDRINKAVEYMKEKEKQGTLWFVKSTDELFSLLKGDKE